VRTKKQKQKQTTPMQNITFALPTVATAGMSASDQRDVLLNQATAVIVAEYLGHMNAAIEKGLVPPPAANPNSFISPSELVTLINDVQAALKGI
jgi:hypothetical protein